MTALSVLTYKQKREAGGIKRTRRGTICCKAASTERAATQTNAEELERPEPAATHPA